MKLQECVILVGGQGTRLRSVVSDIPKPMADINGKPFLAYLLHFLHLQGCSHCVLSVGYKHEIIENYFGNQYLNLKIDYAVEKEPLGTGGGIKNSLDFISQDDFFLLNGDSFFDVNLSKLSEFHYSKAALATLAVKEMHNVDRYGTLTIENSKIISFNEKQPIERGFINAGVYVVSKQLFENRYISQAKFSFEKDILETNVHSSPFYAFESDGYFIDIGIPEDYSKAQMDFRVESL
jgi:D-glycero-alpha-D-manno-heptose 1-phosphate guanylyltransferase